MNRSRDSAAIVTRLQRHVVKVARVLGQEKKSSAAVGADLDAALARIRTRLAQKGLDRRERTALEQMLTTADNYGDKILTCYDHPDIPPTNNGHEHVHGRLRGGERRVTGQPSTAKTVRDGRFLAPVIERAQRGRLPDVEDLARCPAPRRAGNLEAMKRARQHHARPRTIRQHFADALASLGRRAAAIFTRRVRPAKGRERRILRG